jgi:ABC-2 type transport system permease protein
MITILRRELGAFFYSPAAYVVLALFLLLQGIVFFLFLSYLNAPGAPPGPVFQYFFGQTLLYWIAVLFTVAVVPMRLLAEERRSGTIETLLTAPVGDLEVVLGKYLAALAFYAFLWSPTLIYVALVRAQAGVVDPGPIAAGYLGTLLEGAAFMAVGTLASALSSNQIVAAVLSFVFGFALLLVGVLGSVTTSPAVREVLAHVSLLRQMQDFSIGIVDTRHVVFLLSVVVLSLFGAVRALESRRWT